VSHARTAPLECSHLARPNNTGLLSLVRSGLRKQDGVLARSGRGSKRCSLHPNLDWLETPQEEGASGFHTFRDLAPGIVTGQTGNLKLAQKLLGHSTIKMTADIYTRTSAVAERESALAVERAIYGDLFEIVPNLGNSNYSAAFN
jgi:integrase